MTAAPEVNDDMDIAAEWPEYLELLDLVGHVEPGVDITWSAELGVWLSGSYRGFRLIANDPDLFQFPGRNAELAPPWLDRDFYMWFEGGPKKFQFTGCATSGSTPISRVPSGPAPARGGPGTAYQRSSPQLEDPGERTDRL